MAETPSGYLPDFKVQWDLAVMHAHATEMLVSRSGREQRRAMFPTTGYRRWTALSDALSQADRKTLLDFFQAKRGKLTAFNFWRPDPANFTSYSLGTVSAATTLYIPFKNSASVSNVTVAGVSQAVTLQNAVGPNGEDQITFTAGAQSGAVVGDVTGGRERVVTRFDVDELVQGFVPNVAEIRSVFQIAIKEVL